MQQRLDLRRYRKGPYIRRRGHGLASPLASGRERARRANARRHRPTGARRWRAPGYDGAGAARRPTRPAPDAIRSTQRRRATPPRAPASRRRLAASGRRPPPGAEGGRRDLAGSAAGEQATAWRRSAGRRPWRQRRRASGPAESFGSASATVSASRLGGSSGGSRRSVPSSPVVTNSCHRSVSVAFMPHSRSSDRRAGQRRWRDRQETR